MGFRSSSTGCKEHRCSSRSVIFHPSTLKITYKNLAKSASVEFTEEFNTFYQKHSAPLNSVNPCPGQPQTPGDTSPAHPLPTDETPLSSPDTIPKSRRKLISSLTVYNTLTLQHFLDAHSPKFQNSTDLCANIQTVLDKEIKTFAKKLMTIWFDVQPHMFHIRQTFHFRELKEKYRQAKRDRILQLIIGGRVVEDELVPNNYGDVATEHKDIANTKRESNYVRNMLQFTPNRIEDKKYLDRGNMIPIIFEETVVRPSKEDLSNLASTRASSVSSKSLIMDEAPKKAVQRLNTKKEQKYVLTQSEKQQILESTPDPLLSLPKLTPEYLPFASNQMKGFSAFGSLIMPSDPYASKPLELVILCHGLQGTYVDMVKTKHYLCLSNSSIEVVCSRVNEDQTTKDIAEMGINLAGEVQKLVNQLTKQRRLLSLSFVGHSLGGLIIRSALPHLENLKDYMKAFVTMSTPHLGVATGDSKLVETGFSLLTSWAKHQSLEQMGMKDTSDPYNSFIYRLSTKPGLDWFQEVMFISSPQDTYSPFDSSRVQVSTKNSSNLKYAQAYADMVDNILAKIACNRLRRIDVCLKFAKSNLDTFIGRAAHIAMINDGVLLEMLAYRYSHLL